MSIETRMTRAPRPFDSELGRAAGEKFTGLSAPLVELIVGASGSSPYLDAVIHAQADWLPQALYDPEQAIAAEFAELKSAARDTLGDRLRRSKTRVSLIAALADLSGAWPLETVTRCLSDFAALSCDLALKAALEPLLHRGKLPGQTFDDLETAAGLSVLAMGKLGAHELNYSSDIDLICLFDETRYDEGAFFEVRQSMVKAVRAMCTMLSERTAGGYVFRTDLRLRPDPAVTPVVVAMEAAERYYESLGRTWERAAYIKARACAGDLTAGAAFLQTLKPFVWRRHLDFAAIEDAHDMRLRIRSHKGLTREISVPGHDMKLGRGGIREIEFFTQTRQLIAGGRDPDLRPRETVSALAALAEKDWVPADVSFKLTDHYRFHREVEHRIQMVHDAQTHTVPATADGFSRIACLMGRSEGALKHELAERLTEVHALTDDFFAPVSAKTTPTQMPEAPDFNPKIVARWAGYPALRSERARSLFEKLKPELLSRVQATAKPDETLAALDGFLAGLPAGVQIFSLLSANPPLVDLLIDIAGTSSELASYLSRNASVFDAVIGGDFFAPWPSLGDLTDELATKLSWEADYENQLDTARRWAKDVHFRIGVHQLRGLMEAPEVGACYADLADAVMTALWPVVVTQFSMKHGKPPGRGAAILGMGSLGAQRLHAASDLDVIVIYDPDDVESSDGPRPLASRTYYARLTQALITAMTAQMSQGRLYEVDMRLRPSGNQGPVATSLASFRSYQKEEAWTWEHLALTRARVITGAEEVASDIEKIRAEVLGAGCDHRRVLDAVSEMRERIEAAKTPVGPWDAKTGRGRMQDIELLAQAGALISGNLERGVPEALKGACEAGLIDAAVMTELCSAYADYSKIHQATRLISAGAVSEEALGDGGVAFLLRVSGADSIERLRNELSAGYERCAHLIDAATQNKAGSC